MPELKKTLINGSLWAAGGQILTLVIGLAANIWLARLLMPKEFGQVGIIMFFITLANVVAEGGMAGALVRKKSATAQDYATVFLFNIAISVFLYLLLLLSAPTVAQFYNDADLQMLLVYSGLVLLINAFQITQFARLISEQRFKQNAIYRVTSVLIASVVGIIAAYRGAGVMSLVIIQLLTALIMTVELWVFEGFFFKLNFSKEAFKGLYKFGANTTLSSIINTAFENVYQLILGKYFDIRQAGFYYQAKKLQDIPGGIASMIVSNVVFSTLSKLQDDKKKFAAAFNKMFIFLSLFQALSVATIYLYAEPIIYYLFGNKWMDTVVYIQLLSIATVFAQIELINRQIFKVFDKTHIVLYLEILKKIIQSVTIVIGVLEKDIFVLLIGFIISSIISYFLNHFYSRRIIKCSKTQGLYNLLIMFSWTAGVVLLFSTIFHQFSLSMGYMVLTAPLFYAVYFLGLRFFNIFNIFILLKKHKTYFND